MTRRSKSCKDTFVPFPEKIAHFDAGIINFSNSCLPKYFYNFPYFTGFLAYSLVK